MGSGRSKEANDVDESGPLINPETNGNGNRGNRRGNGGESELSDPNERIIRHPIQYYSINRPTESEAGVDRHTEAAVHRYKYYNRLASQSNGPLDMPDHVVPANFTIKVYVPVTGQQSSLITIFSLWNTMMGTSLLSMPWAIKQAGFVCGIVLLIFMAGVMLYTSYRVLKSVDVLKGKVEVLEFSDVCKHYFGKTGELLAVICSLLTLLGGMIVYWILMSNFLYHVVSFIHDHAVNNFNTTTLVNLTKYSDAVCPKASIPQNSTFGYSETQVGDFPLTEGNFYKIWDEQMTVPFFLILVLFPIINFKSPTFFTKFNALGTVSVAYLFVFAAVKAAKWGIHLDFSSVNSVLPDYTTNFKMTFPALTGISALAYFVQNCCISITRNQKNPQNNIRDLTIAYLLVCGTYVYMGVVFYSSFPLAKSCIEDNLLNNIETNDIMAFVARIGLFFQMLCVFPLLIFILRLQFMHSVFGSVWPSLKHVLVLNVVLIGVCLVFAIFLPHIGRIIGFVGAFCGFSYAICLPCLVYLKACYLKDGGLKLTWMKIIFHGFLILMGLGNFIGQFLIIGHTT